MHYVIQNRGAEVPLPFIGLSQFVNRFNCGQYPNDVTWQGCLQNAILRADVAGANLSNRTAALGIAPVFGSAQASANTTLAGAIPYVQTPANAMASHPQASPSTNRNHVLRAAPTRILLSSAATAMPRTHWIRPGPSHPAGSRPWCSASPNFVTLASRPRLRWAAPRMASCTIPRSTL